MEILYLPFPQSKESYEPTQASLFYSCLRSHNKVLYLQTMRFSKAAIVAATSVAIMTGAVAFVPSSHASTSLRRTTTTTASAPFDYFSRRTTLATMMMSDNSAAVADAETVESKGGETFE
jgi:hypothetical protein